MSTAIAKNFQIGADGTATNNFTIFQPASPDGTLRIGNGNTGITTGLMTLTSAGNLGIGTSSPAAPLEVARNQNATTGIRVTNTDSTANNSSRTAFQLADSGGVRAAFTYINAGSASGTYIGSVLGGNLNFTSGAGVTNAILDSSGNLGLGVTPSALLWPNGSTGGLQMQAGALLSAYNATTYLSNNWYYNAGEKYIGNGYATRYEQTQGKHAWYYAGNNTSGAGATVSWTQAMTLDASGQLGIGTTSPGSQLHLAKALSSTQTNAIQIQNTGIFTWGIGIDNAVSNSSLVIQSGGAGGTTRMAIDSSGNLLVGTTSSSGRFTVSETGNPANQVSYIECTNASFNSRVLSLNASRNVTSSEYQFLVCSISGVESKFIIQNSGNAQNRNNSYGAISDAKLKDNVVDATPKLDDLMRVRVRHYNFKSTPQEKQIGVVAQELEQIFPGMVEESPDRDEEGNDLGTTTKAVKYSVFVPMLIKAIQELNAKVEAQAAEIAALKGQA